jgi:methyltransferase (TIGR00027 family)
MRASLRDPHRGVNRRVGGRECDGSFVDEARHFVGKLARERMRASRTAQYVAFYRALETVERRRPAAFSDPFAEAFLAPSLRLAVRAARARPIHTLVSRYADRRAPGARTNAIARTAFIDDVVRESVTRGVEQLVLLGAGFDCRAHRLPELRDVRVFEVDREATQAIKRARLARLPRLEGRSARDDVRYVGVDFLRDDVAERLGASGWERKTPTLFLWEGVTNYLTERAVEEVLSWIGSAGEGSTLVFTYIHAGLLDGSVPFDGGARMMRNVQKLGEPWRFGLAPERVAPFITRFGLTLREDLGADEYRRRCFGAHESRGYAFYRIAVADILRRAAKA